MPRLHPNTVLGLVLVILAGVLLVFWLPFDTDTGLYEIKRRKFVIGDALAPAFAGVLLAVSGILLLIGAKPDDAARLSRSQVTFLAKIIALIAVSMALMRWTGPLFTAMFDPGEYRLLRDTAPWKYLGFALGGVTLVTGLVSLVERRFSRNAVLTGLFAVALIITLYDLPFEDLLLPPNGDVG